MAVTKMDPDDIPLRPFRVPLDESMEQMFKITKYLLIILCF